MSYHPELLDFFKKEFNVDFPPTYFDEADIYLSKKSYELLKLLIRYSCSNGALNFLKETILQEKYKKGFDEGYTHGYAKSQRDKEIEQL